MLLRFYSSSPAKAKPEPPSRHALLYRKWPKPIGKVLLVSIGSYYSLMYLWEYLEKKEIEFESQKHVNADRTLHN